MPDAYQHVAGIKDLGTGLVTATTENLAVGHLPRQVVRLVVTQSNGSKSDAALSPGFFVWRGPRLAKPSRLPDGTMAYGPDGRSTFRGHDAAGQVVVTLHDSP